MLILPITVAIFGLVSAFPEAKSSAQHSQRPVVATPLGSIQGSTLTTRQGRVIYAFRGIRYAQPPVGELRFQPPVPVERWEGILNATEDGPLCPQPVQQDIPVAEDCLMLNVYSNKLPKGNDKPKRPVVVFFHHGGFYSITGRSDIIGPQYYMDHDVVLVVPNYRLGSLGFISTGDKHAPGNNGLKDQVVVLKWVKQNIAAFGGDPDLVTIAGYSAGSWSVTLHLVSPMSQGLFHRAIAMSGSAVSNWQLPPHQLNLAQKQACLVSCANDTSENIIKCLKTKSAEEIGNSLPGFAEFGGDPVLIWSPVVEPDFGQERFLTADPAQLISEGKFAKVPFMTGVTADEFAGPAVLLLANATLTEQFDKEFERIAPIAFLYERDTDRSREISRSLRQFYLGGNKPIDNSSLTGLAQLYADGLVGYGVNRIVRLISANNDKPTFYYRFSYKGRFSHFYLPNTNNTVPYGVVHHDDLIYLFYNSVLFPKLTEADPEIKTVNRLTALHANFVRTGNPTPDQSPLVDTAKWEPFTVQNKKYYDIDSTLTNKEGLYADRYAEWDKFFPLPSTHLHDASSKSNHSG